MTAAWASSPTSSSGSSGALSLTPSCGWPCPPADGWIGQLVVGAIGAIMLIWLWRMVRGPLIAVTHRRHALGALRGAAHVLYSTEAGTGNRRIMAEVASMTTIIDTVPAPRPAPSGKGAPAGHADPAQAGLDSRQGAAARRSIRETTDDRARARPRHRLRGGRLPQHRRVLVEAARHLHDHGRHLHARLRLLQRAHRHAAARSTPTSRSRSPTPPPSSASTMSSSPRSTATTSTTAARRISPRRSPPSAARSPARPSRC